MRVKRRRAPLVIVVVTLTALFVMIVLFVSSQLNKTLSTQNDLSKADTTEPTLQFTAAGDFDNTPNTAAVLAKIAQTKSTFTLGLGDFSYSDTGSEKEWCSLVKKALGNTYPFMLVAGNHDTAESSKTMNIDRYAACLPNRLGSTDGAYGQQYFFDISGLARFIMISPALTIDGHSYSYTKDSADYAWVQNAIDQAHTSQMPWVIVGMHKNCITIGEKTCEIGPDLLNMLIDKHVDLVLQGHEHGYMRTSQLVHSAGCTAITPTSFSDACINKGKDDASSSFTAGTGTVLAIVGTGGTPLRPINTKSPQKLLFASYSGLGLDDTYGVLNVKLNAKSLHATFEGTDAKTHDTFSLVK